jgi:hypothetical protein
LRRGLGLGRIGEISSVYGMIAIPNGPVPVVKVPVMGLRAPPEPMV